MAAKKKAKKKATAKTPAPAAEAPPAPTPPPPPPAKIEEGPDEVVATLLAAYQRPRMGVALREFESSAIRGLADALRRKDAKGARNCLDQISAIQGARKILLELKEERLRPKP